MLGVLVEILQSPSNHHLNDFVGRKFRAHQLADIFSVAQDREPVGQFVDLGHPVADVDNRHPFRTKLADNLEQPIRFTIRESRRRFIHHQDPALVEQRARDLDLLLFGNRKMGGALGGFESGTKPIQHLLGLAIHFEPYLS